MNKIIRPISKDGNLGFDKYNQLVAQWQDREWTVSTIVRDLRDETCPICGKGWELSSESFRDCHFIESLGKSFLTSEGKHAHSGQPCHYTCYRGMLRVKEADFWYYACCDREINKGPGFDFDESKNEYGGGWNNPWYRVRFKHLPGIDLIMGKRSRVYEISVRNLDNSAIELLEKAFDGHNGTVGRTGEVPGFYIHADDQGAAKSILAKISNALFETVQMD